MLAGEEPSQGDGCKKRKKAEHWDCELTPPRSLPATEHVANEVFRPDRTLSIGDLPQRMGEFVVEISLVTNRPKSPVFVTKPVDDPNQ